MITSAPVGGMAFIILFLVFLSVKSHLSRIKAPGIGAMSTTQLNQNFMQHTALVKYYQINCTLSVLTNTRIKVSGFASSGFHTAPEFTPYLLGKEAGICQRKSQQGVKKVS